MPKIEVADSSQSVMVAEDISSDSDGYWLDHSQPGNCWFETNIHISDDGQYVELSLTDLQNHDLSGGDSKQHEDYNLSNAEYHYDESFNCCTH